MLKLVAFAGAHCTGKTTTLDYINKIVLPDEKKNIKLDDFKIARTILAEMGLTLDQATTDSEITKIFQQKILDCKIQRDSFLANQLNDFTYLVDRSISDVYAYTNLWARENDIEQDWFEQFEQKCIDSMTLCDLIFIFPINKFDFIDDGIRAKSGTQSSIDKSIKYFSRLYAKKYHIIENTNLKDRANEILSIINSLR